MTKKDFYEVLEISKNATPEEIKKAYRKHALMYHPDRNPDNKEALEKFKEAAEAYEILSDPQKRARYDQYGHAGVGNSGGGFSGHNMTMDDIFSQFGDIFSDFGGFGGFGFGNSRGGRNARRVNKGSNIRIKVSLTLEEISKGAEKKLKVSKYIPCETCSGTGAQGNEGYSSCSTCHGSGHVTRITNTMLGQMQTTSVCPHCEGEGKIIKDRCTTCHGEGIVKDQEVIKINIPAGVAEGMQLNVAGRGNAARRGGVNGDLLVLVEEEKHPELVRDGNDLLYFLYLSFPQAALGTTIEVPTIEGRVKIRIEPGTQPGKVLRLRNKGLPEVNGYGRGDLLVSINVWIPKDLSKEEQKNIEKFTESNNFKPNPTKAEKSFFERIRNYFE
jgi:molecular chaperone DnaJ